MPPRLLTNTKVFYFLVLNFGSVWNLVSGVAARNPPPPTTVEAQAKFFQDFFSVQLSPYKIEFGHVCEDPNTWEQRYEKKDYKNHRDMGKVRWGDKKGGYGEHYWDLNHAGHAGNHGNDGYDGDSDDGSYNPDKDHTHDSYEGPTSDHSATYEKDDYDSEQSPNYEESSRAKRAHPRTKFERKTVKHEEYYEEPDSQRPQKQTRKNKEALQTAPSHNIEKYTEDSEDEEIYNKPLKKKYKQAQPEYDEKEYEQSRESISNQYPVQKKESEDSSEQPTEYVSRAASKHYAPYEHEEGLRQHQQKEPSNQYPVQKKEREDSAEQPAQYVSRAATKHYVPYEHGGGVRQHQQPEITSAASTPRLFLEPSTGHVVDRATGQAYVLQPVILNKSYN